MIQSPRTFFAGPVDTLLRLPQIVPEGTQGTAGFVQLPPFPGKQRTAVTFGQRSLSAGFYLVQQDYTRSRLLPANTHGNMSG